MKLRHIEQREIYTFEMTFENDETKLADLQGLVGQYVAVDELHTAHIDPEWGCLEFLNGQVDIDPKTLYRYVCADEVKRAA
jgi:hypothetical protein